MERGRRTEKQDFGSRVDQSFSKQGAGMGQRSF